jgi:hypothetical protein
MQASVPILLIAGAAGVWLGAVLLVLRLFGISIWCRKSRFAWSSALKHGSPISRKVNRVRGAGRSIDVLLKRATHMFSFFNRSQRTDKIRQALVDAGFSDGADPTKLAVLVTQGQYSGRPVQYFRAFDPHTQDILLASGHVEGKGVVVVNRQLVPEEGPTPARTLALRADHTDDENVVFWDEDRSQLSTATLSARAVIWQRGGSTAIQDVSP